MTRYLIKLISRLTLVCLIILLFALAIGRILPPEDEILFASNFAHGDYEIYLISLNHQTIAQLTRNSVDDFPYAWSPDGDKIVFSRSENGLYSFYMKSIYSSEIRRLTNGQRINTNMSWSPDGQFLTYPSDGADHTFELMLIDLRAGTSHQLTTNNRDEINPQWSPDSRHIVFASNLSRKDSYDIFELDIQTGNIYRLIATTTRNLSPIWSPDGHYLLYTADGDIYLWEPVSNQYHLIHKPSLIVSLLNWSPDSRFITYAGDDNSNYNNYIYKIEIEPCLNKISRCEPQLLVINPQASYLNPLLRPN